MQIEVNRKNCIILGSSEESGLISAHMQRLWDFSIWSATKQISILPPESNFARMVEKCKATGEVVPCRKITELFENTFTPTDRVIFEGIPSSPGQARDIMSILTQNNIKKLTLIYLELSPEQCQGRTELEKDKENRTISYLARCGVTVKKIPHGLNIAKKMLMIEGQFRLPEISRRDLEEMMKEYLLQSQPAQAVAA